MIPKNASYRVYVPQNLCRELTDLGLSPRNVEACSWFLSSLYIHADQDQGCGLPMYSLVMKGVMGGRYLDLIRLMAELEWIEKTRTYYAGDHSNHYALSPQLLNLPWDVLEVRSGPICRNLYQSWLRHQRQRMERIRRSPCLRMLSACLREVEVPEFSREQFLALAKPKLGTPPGKWESVRQRRAARAEHAFHALRQREVMEVSRTGRVFTGLTQMPREFRRWVRLRGQPLVGVDIGNSQPLILGATIRQKRPELAQVADVQEYIALCERGSLYGEIARCAGDMDQATAKERFFGVFFGRVPEPHWKPSAVIQAFADRFPTVWNVVCQMKQQDHREVARAMQATEARIILQDACQRLMDQGIPVLTIHDSVLSGPEYFPAVEAAVLAAFGPYDIRPALRREDYRPKVQPIEFDDPVEQVA